MRRRWRPAHAQSRADGPIRPHLALICNELTPSSREALIDHSAAMIIATPVEELARQLIAETVHAASGSGDELSRPGPIPFDLYVSENI